MEPRPNPSRALMPYLAETFPGLTLNPPLFYRWHPGLRFDLGGHASDCVLDRATALFGAAFSASDPCMVVAQDWPMENRHPRLADVLPLFAFSRRDGAGLDEPHGQLKLRDEEDPELGLHTLTWVEQPAGTVRHERILEAIANQDHGRRPTISGRVYWINPLRNTILHMYDDRGLDLIATSKESLLPIYRDRNSWILEADREQIDKTFSSHAERR